MAARLIIILILISTSCIAQKICDTFPDNYVPKDLNSALIYLDCIWSDHDKEDFMNTPESDAVGDLHMGFGMAIRNGWGLWKGDSGIALYFVNLGVTHADYMSGIILNSFHRYLNKKDINLQEQINEAKIAIYKMKQLIFQNINNNDTVYCSYKYGYVSKKQKYKCYKRKCIAEGIVIAKDSSNLKLKVRLIKSCDKKGIIIFRDGFNIDKEAVIKQNDKTEIMNVGDIKWTDLYLWNKKH